MRVAVSPHLQRLTLVPCLEQEIAEFHYLLRIQVHIERPTEENPMESEGGP